MPWFPSPGRPCRQSPPFPLFPLPPLPLPLRFAVPPLRSSASSSVAPLRPWSRRSVAAAIRAASRRGSSVVCPAAASPPPSSSGCAWWPGAPRSASAPGGSLVCRFLCRRRSLLCPPSFPVCYREVGRSSASPFRLRPPPIPAASPSASALARGSYPFLRAPQASPFRAAAGPLAIGLRCGCAAPAA